jgi:hypothetical protein
MATVASERNLGDGVTAVPQDDGTISYRVDQASFLDQDGAALIPDRVAQKIYRAVHMEKVQAGIQRGA